MGDEQAGAIIEHLVRLEVELRDVADVERTMLQVGTMTIVKPRNPEALGMSWIVMKDEIVFQAGHEGGRWELAKTPEGVAWMEGLVNAVAHGQVTETFGPKRSTVNLRLGDATSVSQTGHSTGTCWLPAPRWRPRGRTVVYASYFD